jgi:hypothetical protein
MFVHEILDELGVAFDWRPIRCHTAQKKQLIKNKIQR